MYSLKHYINDYERKEIGYMATRVDKAGIEGCVTKVNTAIEALKDAAKDINATMNELPNYWEGAAYDKAKATYDEEYKTLLTQTVFQQQLKIFVITLINVWKKSLNWISSYLENKIIAIRHRQVLSVSYK